MLPHYGSFAEALHLHIAANTFPSTTIKFGPSFVHLISIAFAILAISKRNIYLYFCLSHVKNRSLEAFSRQTIFWRSSRVVASFEAQDVKYILLYLANQLVENMKLLMIPPAFQETAHESIGDFADQKETKDI